MKKQVNSETERNICRILKKGFVGAVIYFFEGNNCNVGVPARHHQEIALQPNSWKAFLQGKANFKTGPRGPDNN